MPYLHSPYLDFFYGPLTRDVEELLSRFQYTDSVRFEVFSALWRDMRFSDVFAGIGSFAETKRFCRIAMATAMKFFLPPYSYHIRVGGLYAAFALFHTQTASPPANARLALKDWEPVQDFLRHSVDAEHYDVVYVYKRLVEARAFHYTSMPHALAFLKQQSPKEDELGAEFLEQSSAVQELMSAEALDELAGVHELYEKLKEATEEVQSEVSMTHKDFSAHLKGCVVEFMERRQTSRTKEDHKGEDVAEVECSGSSRAQLLSSIKQRSYTSFEKGPRSRRHRQAEPVDSSGSGGDRVQEAPRSRRKKPLSLRTRTWETLPVVEEKITHQGWLLSAPENPARVPQRRVSQPSKKTSSR